MRKPIQQTRHYKIEEVARKVKMTIFDALAEKFEDDYDDNDVEFCYMCLIQALAKDMTNWTGDRTIER